MDLDYFRFLYDFQYWARDRLLVATDGMSQAEYESPNRFTYGSIRGILVHCLAAEATWLRRWQDDDSTPEIDEESVPDLAALKEKWSEQEAAMRAYLAALLAGQLSKEFGRASSGRPTLKLWQLLAHVVNHSTQHRSEAAEALTMAGRSPGNLDMTVFIRDPG